MLSFKSDCFTELYVKILSLSLEHAKPFIQTRTGFIKDLGPLSIEIDGDNFRMPILKNRGFNPVFALCEFAWILSGSNELRPLTNYISSFANYSDDRETLNGAYGFRLRSEFGFDQISKAIDTLRTTPNTRRIVLQIWSPSDLGKSSNDIPCNTQVMLKIRDNKLDITTTNRSNDIYLGIPYNIYTFFMLQQYIAQKLNIPIGKQYHFTDSAHIYQKDIDNTSKILSTNTRINYNLLKNLAYNFNWDSFISHTSTHLHLLTQKLTSIENELLEDSITIYNFHKNLFDTIKSLRDDKNLLTLATLLWTKTFNLDDNIYTFPLEKEIFDEC